MRAQNFGSQERRHIVETGEIWSDKCHLTLQSIWHLSDDVTLYITKVEIWSLIICTWCWSLDGVLTPFMMGVCEGGWWWLVEGPPTILTNSWARVTRTIWNKRGEKLNGCNIAPKKFRISKACHQESILHYVVKSKLDSRLWLWEKLINYLFAWCPLSIH